MALKFHVICGKCGNSEDIGFVYNKPQSEKDGVGVSVFCRGCGQVTSVEEWNELNEFPDFSRNLVKKRYKPKGLRDERKDGVHLVISRMKTPDGTILHSKFRHDYVMHKDSNGEEYFLDGGVEYQRHSMNMEPMVDLSVHSDADHETIREVFFWGTRGKSGREPLEYKPLKELTAEHIEAILETQQQVPEWRKVIFRNELEYRNNN